MQKYALKKILHMFYALNFYVNFRHHMKIILLHLLQYLNQFFTC